MSDCSGGKVALVKLLGHGNWEKHFWVENGLIHWEQQRMSGELFNETDNKFYMFYFGQQGLWAQGFGKMEPKWIFLGWKMGKFCTICGWCTSMRINAHLVRISRYIRMANPNSIPSQWWSVIIYQDGKIVEWWEWPPLVWVPTILSGKACTA